MAAASGRVVVPFAVPAVFAENQQRRLFPAASDHNLLYSSCKQIVTIIVLYIRISRLHGSRKDMKRGTIAAIKKQFGLE